ncbi:MAG: sterol desaturase family protein [Segetibacter sp.]
MNEFETILKSIQPYAIGITFIALYAAEYIFPQRKDILNHKHNVENILIGILNFVIAGAGGYFLQVWLTWFQHHHFGLLQFLPYAFWLKTATGFILIDLFMYGWHKANHQIRFLWYFHSFHHKDENMNSTSAIRFHSIELLLSFAVKFIVFPLLGLNVAAVLLHAVILFPVIVFHHSNIRITEKDLITYSGICL